MNEIHLQSITLVHLKNGLPIGTPTKKPNCLENPSHHTTQHQAWNGTKKRPFCEASSKMSLKKTLKKRATLAPEDCRPSGKCRVCHITSPVQPCTTPFCSPHLPTPHSTDRTTPHQSTTHHLKYALRERGGNWEHKAVAASTIPGKLYFPYDLPGIVCHLHPPAIPNTAWYNTATIAIVTAIIIAATSDTVTDTNAHIDFNEQHFYGCVLKIWP